MSHVVCVALRNFPFELCNLHCYLNTLRKVWGTSWLNYYVKEAGGTGRMEPAYDLP